MKKRKIIRIFLLLTAFPLSGGEPFHSSLSVAVDENGVVESKWTGTERGISASVLLRKGEGDPQIAVNLRHRNFKIGKPSFEGLLFEMKAREITVSEGSLAKSAVDINRSLLSGDYNGMAVSCLNDNLGIWFLEFDGNNEIGLWQNIYPFSWMRLSFSEVLSQYRGEDFDDFWYKTPEPYIEGLTLFGATEATLSFRYFLFRLSGSVSLNENLPVGGNTSAMVMFLWPGGRIYSKGQFNTREFITLRGESRKDIFQLKSGFDSTFFDFIIFKVTHTLSVDFYLDAPIVNDIYAKAGIYFPLWFFSFFGGIKWEDNEPVNPWVCCEAGIDILPVTFSVRSRVKFNNGENSPENLIEYQLYNRVGLNIRFEEGFSGGVEANFDKEEKDENLWKLSFKLISSFSGEKFSVKGEFIIKDILCDQDVYSGESLNNSPFGFRIRVKLRK